MSNTPIADYALLSDRHSTALVTTSGSVDWLAFPRFDSPSVMGRLLGDEAGYWQVSPSAPSTSRRRYLDQTLVLETTFSTAEGTLVLTDAMALGLDDSGHRLGADVPHVLVRKVACTEGAVEVAIDYQPRPEYGLIVPLLHHVEGGVTARGGAEWLVLTAEGLTIEGSRAHGRRAVRAGDEFYLAVQRSSLEESHAHVWSQGDLAQLLTRTIDAWRSWAALHQAYDGPWKDLVHHSGIVLEGLSFQPSGAVVAAATTSLPEDPGGERNWDYRYSWVRDASFTMEALWVAACPHEAADFFAFMTTAAASSVGPDVGLQIMFGVGGEHDLSERELDHLPGWRDSRPVRVGNDAWRQRQIDVYGELLGAASRLADQLAEIDNDTKRFLVACADAAASHWVERDQGIWEVRSDPQHFLCSKIMCWVALDRAVALADRIDATDSIDRWTATRDEIWETVVREGWSEQANAFTQYFGSNALDASTLLMANVGFLPADDPRMLATIDAIDERLTDDRGLVYRYRTDAGIDGLDGDEGAFILCTFWLAQALALAGQIDRAREVFERAATFVNDVGLLAEEVDSLSAELLGNFPQAFSHIGLINAAWAISEAERLARTSD